MNRLGIASAEDLAAYTPDELCRELSASPRICTRLVRLAEAATYPLGGADDAYRVEMCREVASDTELPPISLTGRALRAKAEGVHAAIDKRCTGAPSVEGVMRWLTQQGPGEEPEPTPR